MIPENTDTRLPADCHPQLVLPSSDTPETDEAAMHHGLGGTVAADFARDLERRLNAAVAALTLIEERYIEGCDTCEDWKFMGYTACKFLSENK